MAERDRGKGHEDPYSNPESPLVYTTGLEQVGSKWITLRIGTFLERELSWGRISDLFICYINPIRNPISKPARQPYFIYY